MAIVVEGISRFRVKQYRQRTPFIEAEVEHFDDDPVKESDTTTRSYFTQLKALSRDLVALLRMSSSRGAGLPPMIARRLELLIARKDINDAGSLADFMISAVETRLFERLDILAAVEVPERLQKAVVILTRQVNKIKSIIQKSNKLGPALPPLIVMDNRRSPSYPPGQGGFGVKGRRGSFGGDDDSAEDEEYDELVKKIEFAKLSPEALKVARRELQRLKRMNPAQAEYSICRTYLETLTEVSTFLSFEKPSTPVRFGSYRRLHNGKQLFLDKTEIKNGVFGSSKSIKIPKLKQGNDNSCSVGTRLSQNKL